MYVCGTQSGYSQNIDRMTISLSQAIYTRVAHSSEHKGGRTDFGSIKKVQEPHHGHCSFSQRSPFFIADFTFERSNCQSSTLSAKILLTVKIIQVGSSVAGLMHGIIIMARYDLSGNPYSFTSPNLSFLDKKGNPAKVLQVSTNLTGWSTLYYQLQVNFDGHKSSFCSEVVEECCVATPWQLLCLRSPPIREGRPLGTLYIRASCTLENQQLTSHPWSNRKLASKSRKVLVKRLMT